MSDATTQTNILDAQNAEIVAVETALGVNLPTRGAWTSYTPVLSGSGWAIGGAGSDAQGAWCAFNNVVHFWMRLVTGTGATFGAATVPQISLPTACEAGMYSYVPRGSVVGQIVDASTGTPYKCGGEISGGIVSLMVEASAAAYVTYTYALGASVPMAWAVGDYVALNGWYRKA